MANPTSAFGWQMPTSTDLVTDLPADFEVFGQAVDTSLADLKGGTTGQVLSKATNADMDFTWVTSDDANAIQNAIVDAKGDLIAASAADTPARLAVGADGETLVADSSTSTGLRYQASMAAGRNFWMNGGLAIWQRGTSFSTSSAYTADRWYNYFGSGTFTIARVTTDIPTGFQYGIKVTSSGATASVGFYQAVETANAIQLAGKTVTMSGYIQSSNSGTYTMDIGYSTNTDEAQSGSFTSIGGQGVVSTTTSTRFSITFAIPSTAKSLRFNINTPSLASGATATITGMQVEIGSIATNFSLTGGTIQGELAACQRYYWRNTAPTATAIGYAIGRTSTQADIVLSFPVTMRTNPTAVETGGTFDFTNPNVGAWYITSFTFVHCSYQTGFIKGNTASGLSQGVTYELGIPTSGYVGFSAEL